MTVFNYQCILKNNSFLIFFLLFPFFVFASDSLALTTKPSLFVIPHASYQQETSWSAGVAFGYYFKNNSLARISSVSGSAVYTLNNQFILNITPKIYFDHKKWYLYSNINWRNYPDLYYGIGNKPTNLVLPFLSQSLQVILQPQRQVSKNFYVGAHILFRADHTTTDTTAIFLEQAVFNTFGREGWTPFSNVSVGAIATYDSRNSLFYATEGLFLKTVASLTPSGNKPLVDYVLDFRSYVPLFEKQTLAFQMLASGSWGSNAQAFQLLPTLGGRDVLRGFRHGMYRDEHLAVLQTELRTPVYKKLKAAFFASAGDVYSNKGIYKLKVGYGAGLRYQLNDARVHLRFDVAKNNYTNKLQFYITATEAF